MTRRFAVLSAAALLVVGLLGAPAAGAQPQQLEEHGHMLVLGMQVDLIEGAPHLVGFRKCIDMPVVTNRAHHANIHTGPAGEALMRAGHAFIPSYNFPTPWESCTEFEGFLPFPLPG